MTWRNDGGGCAGGGAAKATWKYAKCAAAVGVAAAPPAKGLKVIKELGGAETTVKLLWGASKPSDFLKIAGGVGAEVLGIAGIENYRF
nr:hypothetical protein [Rhodococcus qingshengii]